MRESDLRPVLLAKAIEESDTGAMLVPAADRAAASREARREIAPAGTLRLEDGRWPAAAERLLAARSRLLLAPLRARHPVLDEVLSPRAATGLSLAVCVAALAIGMALSALDGSRRIDILAFPLWGLVAWNLVVYAVVVAAWTRKRGAPRPRPLIAAAARAVMAPVSRIVDRARHFHAPLSAALARFLQEWQPSARGLLAARATALFHFAAALVGAGLIAGLYLRGLALAYEAGWESTFLDAQAVHRVLRIAYAPASHLTGIPVPDVAHMQSIRWREGAGGEPAAPWIHLLAATIALLVIAPRLALAALARLSAWRAAASVTLPAGMAAYFDRCFHEAGLTLGGAAVRIVPVAYGPAEDALVRLRTYFPDTAIELRPAVPYGHEEDVAALAREPDAAALAFLFTLAATPEEETHGRAIATAREALRAGGTRLDALVDEGPYTSRMGPSLEARVEERRRAWQRFLQSHGIEARFVDLSR